MPNQFNMLGAFYFFTLMGILYPFYANTVDLIKMQIPSVLVCSNALILNWFGDYRGLRFLCGYFGSRTFYFVRIFLQQEIEMRNDNEK